jgi:hypothetical protein
LLTDHSIQTPTPKKGSANSEPTILPFMAAQTSNSLIQAL